ncbi:unnamed protein product [Nezara viridula]|uniref:Uncharacterized protein n=1 Tax=Nezara viridula TaxID=85310 RepID=A0A9P0HF25_NEZVI|nr:unnamed protein product [Nezara viridula]
MSSSFYRTCNVDLTDSFSPSSLSGTCGSVGIPFHTYEDVLPYVLATSWGTPKRRRCTDRQTDPDGYRDTWRCGRNLGVCDLA